VAKWQAGRAGRSVLLYSGSNPKSSQRSTHDQIATAARSPQERLGIFEQHAHTGDSFTFILVHSRLPIRFDRSRDLHPFTLTFNQKCACPHRTRHERPGRDETSHLIELALRSSPMSLKERSYQLTGGRATLSWSEVLSVEHMCKYGVSKEEQTRDAREACRSEPVWYDT